MDLRGGGQILQRAGCCRAPAEQLRGLVGQGGGVVLHRIAGTDQLEGRQAGAGELGESVEVPVAHAAAADDGQMDSGVGHARSGNRETALLTGWVRRAADLRVSI